MATINCTNTKAQPAIKGQSVLITLSGAESLSVLPVLSIGDECLSESSQAVGYIDFIDEEGHSFRVKPAQPNFQFNSGETNTMAVDELITITY